MPIVQFHLIEGRHAEEAVRGLLLEASQFYVDTLYPGVTPRPSDRVRAFVSMTKPQHWATAEVLASEGGTDAPYFTCLTLTGRPDTQLHALLKGFTDLIAKHLGCEPRVIRGRVIPIDPNQWSIGGAPASDLRKSETHARQTGEWDGKQTS